MYVVTGGAGFVGSNLVRALNARGVTDILVVDNLETNSGKFRNLTGCTIADYQDKREFLRRLGISLEAGIDLRKVLASEAARSPQPLRARVELLRAAVDRGLPLADATSLTCCHGSFVLLRPRVRICSFQVDLDCNLRYRF